MIVVEDIEANEIHRFFVVDSSVRLGIVRAGTSIRTFDPDRAFLYNTMLENQLHDFAGKYPGAFKYLPRRAYDYLKKSEILSEFYSGTSETSRSSWLADLMLAAPMIRLSDARLPDAQKDANAQSVYRWTNIPPHSTRLYNLQDMRLGRRTPNGWGCLLEVEDLKTSLKGPNRNDLLTHLKGNRPVFIEVGPPEDTEPLLEWLVLLKEAGLGVPNTVLSVKDHRKWSKDLRRLLEIPGSRLLTSGATISSLASLARYAKTGNEPWSKRLIYASSYPETQIGDSVSEILSYLLSRNLDAKPQEVQRVLGGNMLSMLPPRPPHLYYTENQNSVMAEESLGRSAMNELVRILQILQARNLLIPNSLDFMTDEEGGSVFLDGAILTVMDPATEKATSLSILLDKDGSVMLSGWKKAFTDTLVARDSLLLQTLTRANARLDGATLDSPAHLTRFDEELLRCLQVPSPRDVMSALHFGVEIAKTDSGVYLMAPSDMDALELTSGELVLALDVRRGLWFPAAAKEHSRCSPRAIVVSESDADLYGFRPSTVVNVVKLQGEITELSNLVMACSSPNLSSGQELESYLHLHQDEIRSRIDGNLVSIDSTFQMMPKRRRLTLTVAGTTPRLEVGHLGRATGGCTKLRPMQAFRELDILICISTAKDMRTRDIHLETPTTARKSLSDISESIPEIRTFLGGLGREASRAEIAALATMHILSLFAYNDSEGRLGLVTFAEEADKFSIQHGERIRTCLEFSEDMRSQEVTAALLYSVLDTLQNSSGREDLSIAYRSVAEYLEDFSSDRPTLVLMFTSGIGEYDEDHLPFIQAISKHERYRLELFAMGNNASESKSLRLLKGLSANLVMTKRFSSQRFVGHLLDTVQSLVPGVKGRSES
jgi:hypothetical protein